MLSHNPLQLHLLSPLSPLVCRLQLFSVLSSSSLRLPCLLRRAGPPRSRSKVICAMADFGFPALAFLWSWPGGRWTRRKPYAGWSLTSRTSTTLDRCSQHLALFPFSSRSCSTGIWPTVGGSLSSLGLTSLQLLSTFGYGPSPLSWPLIRPVLAYGGRLKSNFSRMFQSSFTISPGRSSPSTFLSLFLLLNTRWSVLWLVRCSKIPVSGSFFGSRLLSCFDLWQSSCRAPSLLAADVSPWAAFFLFALRY